MIDVAITGIILFLYLVVALYGVSRDSDGNRFMNLDYTNTIKGLCCIVVVFVHILPAYQNKLQDAMGSFAYIAVTLFMLFSAYGLAYGDRHKESYFNKFFSHRFLVVLIPFALSIAIKYVFGFDTQSGGTGYIWVLLLFYVVTYLSHRIIGGGEMEVDCLWIQYPIQHHWKSRLQLRLAC